MKRKTFTDRIKLYTSFIKEGKVPMNNDFYAKQIVKCKEVLKLLKDGKMTPGKFAKLDSRYRWDVAKELEGVKWLCEECKSDQGTEKPESMFMGERYCSECENLLTCRTNGGQSDPFNYTFKKLR